MLAVITLVLLRLDDAGAVTARDNALGDNAPTKSLRDPSRIFGWQNSSSAAWASATPELLAAVPALSAGTPGMLGRSPEHRGEGHRRKMAAQASGGLLYTTVRGCCSSLGNKKSLLHRHPELLSFA